MLFEGQTMTQPLFHGQTNMGGGGGKGLYLLLYHCSGRIWRSNKSFLMVLSTIEIWRNANVLVHVFLHCDGLTTLIRGEGWVNVNCTCGALSRRFCCILFKAAQIFYKERNMKLLLQHREENIKVFLLGRTNYNQA